MDSMNISGKFMTGVISKIIAYGLKKKMGVKTNPAINNLKIVVNDDGDAHCHLDADIIIPKEELIGLLKKADLF